MTDGHLVLSMHNFEPTLRALDTALIQASFAKIQPVVMLWKGVQRPGPRIVELLKTHDVEYSGLKKRALLVVALALAMGRTALDEQAQQAHQQHQQQQQQQAQQQQQQPAGQNA